MSLPAEPTITAPALQRFMADAFPNGVPWQITALDRHGVELTLTTREADLRPGGTVSGPTMMMLADSAAYAAILSRIGLAELAVTTNVSINFLRRARVGVLVAHGSLLKVGRTQALCEVRLHDGDPDHQVAHAVITYSLVLTSGT